MTGLPEVASRLFDVPLMVHPGKAVAILNALGPRVLGAEIVVEGSVEQVNHVAGKLGDRVGRDYDAMGVAPYDVIDHIAVIPIEGTLVHKGAFVGKSSGRTSYQGLTAQVIRAARDPKVRGIAFEVDSFGGEVAGAFETAQLIHEAGAVKPTMAILTDFALSAGYLLASAAREVVMPAHGSAGSIGVITMHADYSGALDKAGIKVTVLSSGRFKADGNPYAALPEAVAARIQTRIDGARATFAQSVGKFRGARLSAQQALDTEAADFVGPDAVRAGLADAVGNPIEAFAAFADAVNRGRGPARI